MSKNPFLPGFNRFFGRASKSSRQRLFDKVNQIRSSLPGQLPKLFSAILEPEKITGKAGGRNRLFTPAATLIGMCGQVIRGNASLRSAVEEAAACQDLRLGGCNGGARSVANSTGSYSDARARLPREQIEAANRRVCAKMDWGWDDLLPERRILIADGTGFQLEDTPENQDAYPQPTSQAAGCGFPVVQAVGLFDARTHALCGLSLSPLDADEGGMFDVDLASQLKAGDILVHDRGFCAYQRIAGLAQRGIETIGRLHASRRPPPVVKGKDDYLVRWQRPATAARPAHLSEEEWEALPTELMLRYIRLKMVRKGFRTREIWIVTTLTDASIPAEVITQIYQRRWQIELCFDDIKTTLKMDFVRAKSPAMVEKMILTCMLVYNLIRHLIQQSLKATGSGLDSARISFKSTLESLHRYISEGVPKGKRALAHLQHQLYERIIKHRLPDRPNRIEPRVRKRRPKAYPLMRKPRHELHAEIAASMLAL